MQDGLMGGLVLSLCHAPANLIRPTELRLSGMHDFQIFSEENV